MCVLHMRITLSVHVVLFDNRWSSKLNQGDMSTAKKKTVLLDLDTLKEIDPKNTEQSSKWSMTNLEEWFHNYNSRNPDDTCPEQFLLLSCPPDILSKQERQRVPHKTIMSLYLLVFCFVCAPA